MSVKYEVDYNDPRLKSARDGEVDELKESDAMYDSMANDTKKQYDDLIDAAETNKDTQTKLQQERTDLTIKQIEQQKEQSEKDYQKEQAAAYTDYQKQIDPYGVNAEQMAAQGMSGSGYSESSKVRMYNSYQNRVAVARDVAERAKVEYDNAMTEARLQNSSALAEIAASTYETQLKLSIESIQQQFSLNLQKVSARNDIKAKYDSKWLDVLDQINTENALAEEARQYDESLKEEQRQFDILHPQDERILKYEDESSGDDNPIIAKEQDDVGNSNNSAADLNTALKTAEQLQAKVKELSAGLSSKKGKPYITQQEKIKAAQKELDAFLKQYGFKNLDELRQRVKQSSVEVVNPFKYGVYGL